MDAILGWLNDPMVKYVLALVGGFALKRWPAFTNRAIPVTQLGASALIAILAVMFPVVQAHADNALPLAAAQPWWMWALQSIVLPVVLAWGTHSGVKNTAQLAGVLPSK